VPDGLLDIDSLGNQSVLIEQIGGGLLSLNDFSVTGRLGVLPVEGEIQRLNLLDCQLIEREST
jgi:hypothetical protein